MARSIQRSFASGEVAPAVAARADKGFYQEALKTCRNWILQRAGGVTNRPGTQFCHAVKDSSVRPYFLRFAFHPGQCYAIEAGDFYFRFYKDGALVRVSGVSAWKANATMTGATRADPCVVSSTAHGFTNGQRVIISGVTGMTELNQSAAVTAAATAATAQAAEEAALEAMNQAVEEYGNGSPEVYDAYVAYLAAVAASDAADAALAAILASTQTFIVANAAANTFELQGIDSSAFGAYVAGGTISRYYSIGDLVSQSGVNYTAIVAHGNHQPANATYWYPLTDDIFEIPTPYAVADVGQIRYAQDENTLTLVCADLSAQTGYVPYLLTRRGDTNWLLEAISYGPTIGTPQTLADGGAAGATYEWTVTAVDAETGEESNIATKTTSLTVPTTTPVALTWDAVQSAGSYRVYRRLASGGIYGLVGISPTNSFTDSVATPDTSQTIPVTRNPFVTGFLNPGSTAQVPNYPRSVTFSGQRALYGGTLTKPQAVVASKVGLPRNFNISSPLADDDAVTFGLKGQLANPVEHVLEVGPSTNNALLVGTPAAVWLVRGNEAGQLTPSTINPQVQTGSGMSSTPPVIVSGAVIYPAAHGQQVRDLRASGGETGYVGRDVSLYSSHLVKGYTIDRMAFAEVPDSIVWMVRSDGTLIGLTYLPELETFGWHRHDTAADGVFEDVVSIPEDGEDKVYVLVRRTINGATVRYVERFASRFITTLVDDAFFLDAGITYDGAAATVITGLDHLEGETVYALADGNVPPTGFAVSGGSITLGTAASVVHVGLRITADLETLALDAAGSDVRDRRKIVKQVALLVEETRGLYAGPDEDNLNPYVPASPANYGEPSPTHNDRIEVPIATVWNDSGRVFIRQTDPLPATVLAIMALGELGG